MRTIGDYLKQFDAADDAERVFSEDNLRTQRERQKIDHENRQQTIREEVTKSIIPTLQRGFNVVIYLVCAAFLIDNTLIVFLDEYMPQDRIITTEVVIALVAGTVAKVGLLALMAGRWVFGVTEKISAGENS